MKDDRSYRRELYDVRSAPDLSVAEKIDRFLDIGCAYLDVENGHVKRVDHERGEHYVIASAGPTTELATVGDVHDHATAFCRHTVDRATPLAITNADEDGWAEDPATTQHGLQCYLGTKITIAGETFGTLCFVSRTAHGREFSVGERAFVELMTSIIATELATEGYVQRLTDRDKLLAVQNRVLRHNLSNDMNIIRGFADLLAERLDGDEQRMAKQIEEVAGEVVELGQKARLLETIVRDETSPTVEDVVPLVETVTETVTAEAPDATVSVTAPAQCHCVVSTHLQTALRELVGNAIDHGGPDTVVEVTVQQEPGDWCTITVADDGPGLPRLEQRILQGEQETQLQHGQGLGLWIIYWVVMQSGGSLSVETGNGTSVKMQLRHVQKPDKARWARHLFLGLLALK